MVTAERSNSVVVLPPLLDQDTVLLQRVEYLPVQQLVPQFPGDDSIYLFSQGLPGSINSVPTSSLFEPLPEAMKSTTMGILPKHETHSA